MNSILNLAVAIKTLALNLYLTTDIIPYQHFQAILNQNFKHPTSHTTWSLQLNIDH